MGQTKPRFPIDDVLEKVTRMVTLGAAKRKTCTSTMPVKA